jgi:hypothetical protein
MSSTASVVSTMSDSQVNTNTSQLFPTFNQLDTGQQFLQ